METTAERLLAQLPREALRPAYLIAGSEALRVLEQAVAGREHLVGDRFTTADLYMAAFLGYYMMIGVLEKKPAFVEFASRHGRRPAAIAANARDDALAPAHPHPAMAGAGN